MAQKDFFIQRPVVSPTIYAYEDASLEYTGINRHEEVEEDVGLWDTVLSIADYESTFVNEESIP